MGSSMSKAIIVTISFIANTNGQNNPPPRGGNGANGLNNGANPNCQGSQMGSQGCPCKVMGITSTECQSGICLPTNDARKIGDNSKLECKSSAMNLFN